MVPASNSCLLMSAQQDEEYIEHLSQFVSFFLQRLVGPPKWLLYKSYIQSSTSFCYYILTTFSGLQTLGEEYASILMVDIPGYQIPSIYRRSIFAFLYCILPTIINKSLTKLLSRKSLDHKTVKDIVLKINEIHSIFFFLFGDYYYLAHRFSRIKFYNYSDNPSFIKFDKILAILTSLKVIGFSLEQYSLFNKRNEISNQCQPCADEEERCSLCWSKRKETTVTPCGHLFCWKCICQWVSLEKFCPICRYKIKGGNQLIFARNLN